MLLRNQANPDELVFRAAKLGDASGVNAEQRSIPLTLATETPVQVYDKGRGEIIREILVMEGGSWPKQLPLNTKHLPGSTGDQVGSIRNLERVGTELSARGFFASKAKGVEAFNDVVEGHVQDISVGAIRQEVRRLKAGERIVLHGKTYEGPVRLVTKWRAFEGALQPNGADPNSKMLPALRAYLDPQGCLEDSMDEEYREFLISRGMPTELKGREAIEWAKTSLVARTAPATGDTKVTEIVPDKSTLQRQVDEGYLSPAEVKRQIEAEKVAAVDAELKRAEDIRALCRTSPLLDPEATAADLIKRKISTNDAAVEILRIAQPDLKVRVVNVVDLMKLQPASEHPHGMSDKEFDALFTTDKPIIFAFHGYPWLIHRLTYRRTNHDNLHVRGYKEEGTTTTPFDMVVRNRASRYHLVMDASNNARSLPKGAEDLKRWCQAQLERHEAYIRAHLEDVPEVRNWTLGAL